MDEKNILLKLQSGVATLTLNRPAVLNALSVAMVEEMLAALGTLRRDKGVRVLVITGAGRAFCAGADLAPASPGKSGNTTQESHYNPLITSLLKLPFPVIAAVNGGAVGAGCSLALAADFIIAKESSYFLQAFVNIGLVPDMGATWMLPRRIGEARAIELFLLGEKLAAKRAEDWGLVYQTVAAEQFETEVLALATRLAQGPTLAYQLIRQCVRYGQDHTLEQSLAKECESQLTAVGSEDFKEGVAAFKDHRLPQFKGR